LAAADALGVFEFNSCIKNPTPSHRVAVSRSDFVEGPVKVSRPISEKVKVIHIERTVKAVTWFFCRFSIGSCCRPISSNICQPNRRNNLKMPKMPKSVQFIQTKREGQEGGWTLSLTQTLSPRRGL
jgi:hypothetical protein